MADHDDSSGKLSRRSFLGHAAAAAGVAGTVGEATAANPSEARLAVAALPPDAEQVAAEIRRLRPPDAYKGKGIRYSGELVRLKVGKKGA